MDSLVLSVRKEEASSEWHVGDAPRPPGPCDTNPFWWCCNCFMTIPVGVVALAGLVALLRRKGGCRG